MRIHAMRREYGLGPTILRDIRLTFTVEHQKTTDMVYEMSSNINDDTYALAGIHEMGLLKQNWSQFKPVIGQKSPVSYSDIQRCYRSSVWPTPADVAEACGVRTSQTVNEWAECIRSNVEMTTTQRHLKPSGGWECTRASSTTWDVVREMWRVRGRARHSKSTGSGRITTKVRFTRVFRVPFRLSGVSMWMIRRAMTRGVHVSRRATPWCSGIIARAWLETVA